MTPAKIGRGLAPVLAALALASLMLVASPGVTDGYDWLRMHAFSKEYFRDALLSGRLPLWTPHVGLGRPFLADIENAALYPPNLFFLIGPAAGLFLGLVFHLSLSLWGGLRLGRALGCGEIACWFGALGFALGAPALGRLQTGQYPVFCALCWLPLLFACGRRLLDQPTARSAVAFAVTLALLFLTGSPTTFWLGAWGVFIWLAALILCARPPSGRLLTGLRWLTVALGLAVALIAIQALPFLELIGQGNRSGADPAFALRNGMEWASWSSLWKSKLTDHFHYWEYNLYCGFLTPLFALFALHKIKRADTRALLLIIAVFGLLSLGEHSPLLPWLARWIPGWNVFRLPCRYAIIVAFGAVWLAALGLDALRPWLASAKHIRFPLVAGLVIGAGLLDLGRAHRERAVAYANPPSFFKESELLAGLKTRGLLAPDTPPPRVLAPPWIARENSGLRDGASLITSFANPVLARLWIGLHHALDKEPSVENPVNLPMALYIIEPGKLPGIELDARWSPAEETFAYATAPSTRAWLSPEWRIVPHWRDAFDLMGAGHPFRRQAILEETHPASLPPPVPSGVSTFTGGVHLERFAPERVELAYQTEAPSLLVLAEPWYPGWTARVNDRPAPVVPVNGWMRAVALPAGSGRVEFVYRSRWLAVGAALTLLGSLAAVWLSKSSRFTSAFRAS